MWSARHGEAILHASDILPTPTADLFAPTMNPSMYMHGRKKKKLGGYYFVKVNGIFRFLQITSHSVTEPLLFLGFLCWSAGLSASRQTLPSASNDAPELLSTNSNDASGPSYLQTVL